MVIELEGHVLILAGPAASAVGDITHLSGRVGGLRPAQLRVEGTVCRAHLPCETRRIHTVGILLGEGRSAS